jgi:hypothetical protein
MTNHQELEFALKSIRYPKGMVACPGKYCAIRGQSFFPGGRGHIGDDLPVGGIMYLGHNFDKVSGFVDSVNRGREENLTWRKIREGVLPTLSENQIWFTNFFMGLIDGPTNIGALKRTEDFSNYESDCWDFFKLQVHLQNPKVIVALGKEVVRVLGPEHRMNVPQWLLEDKDPYGLLRLKAHAANTIHKGAISHTTIVPGYHPSYGRSAAQLASVVEDAIFVASTYRQNSPHSTT